MHIAQKFEQLLDSYRHPDGSRWTNQQPDEAKGRVVSRSYTTNLSKGRTPKPWLRVACRELAKALDFPLEAWFEEGSAAPFVERAALGGSSVRSL